MNDYLQTHCRRLFLRGHSRMVRIGIHDFEQLAPQRLLFDVDLYVPLESSTPQNDQLAEVVDYDFVRQRIAELCESGHIGLQETLCDALLSALLAHPQVSAVRVSTRKPDVYPDCEAVGVERFALKAGAQ
jgi:7,8-dihydroneopterin aldolase/epimerase/oxygenase